MRYLRLLNKLFFGAGIPGVLLFNNVLFFLVKRRRDLDDNAIIDSSAVLQIIFTFLVFILVFNALFVSDNFKKVIFLENRIDIYSFIPSYISLAQCGPPNFR